MPRYISDKLVPADHIINVSLEAAASVLDQYVSNKLSTLTNNFTFKGSRSYRFEIGRVIDNSFYTLSSFHDTPIPNPIEINYMDSLHDSLYFKTRVFTWIENILTGIGDKESKDLTPLVLYVIERNNTDGTQQIILNKDVSLFIKDYRNAHKAIK